MRRDQKEQLTQELIDEHRNSTGGKAIAVFFVGIILIIIILFIAHEYGVLFQ
jgi:uncharacterized membrane protein YvbJ